jgi:hypothetical protein
MNLYFLSISGVANILVFKNCPGLNHVSKHKRLSLKCALVHDSFLVKAIYRLQEIDPLELFPYQVFQHLLVVQVQ